MSDPAQMPEPWDPSRAAPQSSEPRAPDLIEQLIGFRSWTLQDGILCSQAVGAEWRPGLNRARCLNSLALSHRPPSDGCECGLYAWNSSCGVGYLCPDPNVLGAVAGWGDIYVHREGWRAEFAEIVLLAYDDDQPLHLVRATHAAGRRYGVPVVPIAKLSERAREFGTLVPDQLRPAKPPGESFHSVGGFIGLVPASSMMTASLSLAAYRPPGSPFAHQASSPDAARRRHRWRWRALAGAALWVTSLNAGPSALGLIPGWAMLFGSFVGGAILGWNLSGLLVHRT